MAEGKIKIKLVRSPICTPQKHKNIVKSLGLHKINRVVERPDTPVVPGDGGEGAALARNREGIKDMNLSNLHPPKGQKHKKRRLGQGMGTGRGKYSGRGAKGAKSISGYSQMRGFEGGQMPLHRRLPKRGFTNIFHKDYAIVNVGVLEKLEGDTFTPESLQKSGVVKKLNAGLKILGNGELTRKITVTAHIYSKSALDKIQKQGGSAEVLAKPPAPTAAPAKKASKKK